MILLPFVDPEVDGRWVEWCRPFVVHEGGWIRRMGPGTEYANAIADAWARCAELGRPLTIIEHDIWPTWAEINRLNASVAPATAIPYDFHRDQAVPRHWIKDTSSVRARPGAPWTDFSGIGLIRFSPALIASRPLPAAFRSKHWTGLDRELSAVVTGLGLYIDLSWPMVRHSSQGPGELARPVYAAERP